VAGSDHEQVLLNEKFSQVIEALDNQSNLLNRQFEIVITGLNNQTRLHNEKLNALIAASSGVPEAQGTQCLPNGKAR